MGAPLSKTRTVLERYSGRVYLAENTLQDPESGRGYMLTLDQDVYEDMGRPVTITLTIEPGDALNDPTHPSFSD